MGFLSNKIWVRIFLGHPVVVRDLFRSLRLTSIDFV